MFEIENSQRASEINSAITTTNYKKRASENSGNSIKKNILLKITIQHLKALQCFPICDETFKLV